MALSSCGLRLSVRLSRHARFCSAAVAAEPALTTAFARLVARSDLQVDPSQERAVDLLGACLGRATERSGVRRNAYGQKFWVKPTRTLGTAEAAAAANDRQSVAAWTAKQAKENKKKMKKQAAAAVAASAGSRSTGAKDAAKPAVEDKESKPQKTTIVASDPARFGMGHTVSASDPAAEAFRRKMELMQKNAVAEQPKGDAVAAPAQSQKAAEVEEIVVARPSKESIYMHGPVGTGKTMLLDLFFDQAREAKLRVRRQHFYEFMLGLHERIHAIEDLQPVEIAANTIADEVDVLCFDEFQVTDIQDACILPRLFEVFFLRGIVIIMTSNTSPALLYSGGLNRHVHIPAFVGLLSDYCHVQKLGSAKVDYRRRAEALELAEAASEASSSAQMELDSFLSGADADERLRAKWLQLIQGEPTPTPEELKLPMGRKLHVAEATADSCFVTFPALCGSDRGEAEFLAITRRFSTILLVGVPHFRDLESADMVKRFVKLLDVLYDRRVRLIAASALPIDELFEGIRKDVQDGDIMWRTQLYSSDGKAGMSPGAVGTLCEAIQATERAESRLREMRTRRYVEECAVARRARSASEDVRTGH